MVKLNEIFFDALPLIKKFAPTIGAAFGSPIGLAAGYIIPILANAFDSHPSDLKTLVTNILHDPNASDKLSALEEEHGDWLDVCLDSASNLSKAEINIKLEWQNDAKTS